MGMFACCEMNSVGEDVFGIQRTVQRDIFL